MADHDEEWHREIAKQQFNRCWDLIELAERSPDDEVVMLLAAMTSRWHWGQIGGAEQIATGDWQGKAGGYAIQGPAAALIRHIEGSYSNIVGFSLYDIAAMLRGNGLLR